MKKLIYLWICIGLAGCNSNKRSDPDLLSVDTVSNKQIDTRLREHKRNEHHAPEVKEEQRSYTDQQLEAYLDSIGRLAPTPLMEQVAFTIDSIFRNREKKNETISAQDFAKLKKGCRTGELDISTIKNIFGNVKIDSAYESLGSVPLMFISFDNRQSDFNQFVVCPNHDDTGWDCELFFFSESKLISKHSIRHKQGLDMHHYKDDDGKTVIYYRENYTSGSGVWWYNYCFYKYDGHQLIPVLNELAESNLQYPWGSRVFTLESTVQSTNPLTLKMVYSQAFADTFDSPIFIHDSTVVRYN